MSVPHYDVVLATPGSTHKSVYTESMLQTVKYLTDNSISWTYISGVGSGAAIAREITISGVDYFDPSDNRVQQGRFTYDAVIFIDSDMLWKPESVVDLWSSDKQIVSGCYMYADRTVLASTLGSSARMSEYELRSYTEPFVANTIGLGFVAIKYGVFESMSRPWFGTPPDTDPQLLPDDVSWCRNAQRAGFYLWVNPNVRVGHVKEVIVNW